MDKTMCREDLEFKYPPTVELKFHEARNGMFLLDAGLSLYLFIAKQCEPSLLMDIFGKPKLDKNE